MGRGLYLEGGVAELAEEPQDSNGSAKAGIALAAMLLLAGCFSASPAPLPRAISSSTTGRSATHTVSRGETVYHIAHLYGITPERLMAANGIDDPRELSVGQTLIIPGRGGASVAGASTLGLPNIWAVPRADRQFAWPVASGAISSPFGMRANGTMHEGVDISAPAGTPVLAADDGVVIYTGQLRGYGNVVILQHSGAYETVYAHDRRNLVREGDRVARGQQIGEIGTSGRTSGPNLHFEVRYNNRADDPLSYLPPPAPASASSFAQNNGS
jgi:murein DD-endopeptidase MepM/ murein hydrolase activator NlpD